MVFVAGEEYHWRREDQFMWVCHAVAVTPDVPGGMWTSKDLFLSLDLDAEGKPAKLPATEGARRAACWMGSTRRQGSMCDSSACVMMNVSNLVFVIGLKTKTQSK